MPIEPFNTLFYRNCYYNLLFPILTYFGISVDTFMSHIIRTYELHNSTLSNRYIITKSDSDIFNDYGLVSTDITIKSNHFFDAVQSEINNGNPLIISLKKKGKFDKLLLLVGYDDTLITAIEQKIPDVLSYAIVKKPINEIMQRHIGEEGRADLFNSQIVFTRYCTTHKGANETISACENYIKNYTHNKAPVEGGLELFKSWIKSLEINNSPLYCHDSIKALDGIINSCRVAKEIVRSSESCSEMFALASDVESGWCFARNKLLKTFLSKNILNSNLSVVLETLAMIYDKERKLLDKMMNW